MAAGSRLAVGSASMSTRIGDPPGAGMQTGGIPVRPLDFLPDGRGHARGTAPIWICSRCRISPLVRIILNSV